MMHTFHKLYRYITLALLLALCAGAFFYVSQPASAAFNQQINYQGKLTNASNVAVANGTYNMRFWLLTSPSIATTSAVWTESLTGGNRVQVTNGLFSVMLGSTTSLAGVDFDQTLYLGVEIGGTGGSPTWDGEMSPRKILGAVPAAFEAKQLDGIATSSFLRSDQADTMSASTASTLLTITQSGAGDILNIFDGATEVFSIPDGGNVGIGSTSPYAKLSVTNTGSGPSFIVEDNTSPDSTPFIVDAAGNVGIGTLTPATALDVIGRLRLGNTEANTTNKFSYVTSRHYSTSEEDFSMMVGASNASDNFVYVGGSSGSLNAATEIQFYTAANNSTLTGTQRVTIDNLGYFGIGDTSPDDLLNIHSASAQAALAITSLGTDTDPLIKFELADGTATFSMGVDDSDSDSFKISTTALGTNDRFVINSSGLIGIGDTSPDDLLNISSASAQAALAITSLGTDTDSLIKFELADGTATFSMGVDDSDSDKFKISTTALGTNDRFVIDSSGDVGIGTSTPGANLVVNGTTGQNLFQIATSTNQEILVVNQNGNVGVGTDAPTQALDVIGNVRVQTSAGTLLIQNIGASSVNLDVAGTLHLQNDGGTVTLANASSFSSANTTITTGLVVGAATDKPSQLAVNGNTAIGATYQALAAPTSGLIVEGFVGIGSSTPSARLTVSGQIIGQYLTSTSTTATSTFAGALSVADTKWLQFTHPSGGGVALFQNVAAFGNNDLVFSTAGSPTELVNLAFVAGGSISANSGLTGAGNFTPSLSLNTDGSVQLVNTTQGSAASRYFEVNMTSGARVTTGGFRVDAGNVGVGTTSPFAKLSVSGSAGQTAPLFRIASSTHSAYLSVSNLGALALSSGATTTSTNGFDITTGCYAINGTCVGSSGGGITAIGPTGQTSDGPTVTFATSSDTNIGLTITGSGDTQTFTSTWTGTLADARVADAITISGGTIGSNSISGTLTTTGTLTIGDGGDRIDVASGTWDVTNGVITGATWQGSAIGIGYGGTGNTSVPTDGQLLIGDGAGYTLATLTQGLGMTITNGVGSISLATTLGTSVDLASAEVTGTLPVTRGGTGTTTFAAGGILFASSTSLVSQDTNLFWDNANNRLGIGDTSPDDLLNIHSASAQSALAITSLGTDTDSLIKFELADGTATFSMGVDDSDSDKFKISTTALGTNDRFVIDSSGNVGIASSTPYAKLSVTNTGTGPSFLVEDSTSPDSTPFLINAAGNVAIGTTTISNSFAGVGEPFKMTVAGFAQFTSTTSAEFKTNIFTEPTYTQIFGSDSSESTYFDLSAAFGGSRLNLFDNNSYEIYLSTNGNSYFNTAGNLGIGDTSPDDLLNIHSASAQSALAITSLGTDTDSLIKFELADGTATFSMGVDDSDSDKFKISTTALGTNDRLVIDSSGLVGIASSTPWGRLAVEMDTTNPSFVIANQGSTTPAFYVGGVNQNGRVGIGTTSPAAAFAVAGTGYFSGTLTAAGNINAPGYLINGTDIFARTNSWTGTNTWTGDSINKFTSSVDFGTPLIVETTSADTGGPQLTLAHTSASPAAGDYVGALKFQGRDSGANSTNYGQMATYLVDPTNGTEDAYIYFSTMINGTIANRVRIGHGLYADGATGGDMGQNTANFSAYYLNGSVLTGSGTTGQVPYYASAGSVLTATSSLFIDTNSRIGIGSTTPFSALSVVGNIAGNSILPNGPYTTNLSTHSLGSTGKRWNALWAGTLNIGTSTFSLASNASSNLSFYTAASGGGTEAMTLTTAGRLGIGDTSPDDLLNIHSATAQSALAITSLGTDTDSLIKFELADGTATFSMGVDDSDSDKFKISTTALGTNDRFVIDSSGNVGIASSTPWGRLAVEMDTTNPSFVIANSGSSTPAFYVGGVNHNGYVGIGTSTPTTALTIQASTTDGVAALLIRNDGTSGEFARFFNRFGNSVIRFNTDSEGDGLLLLDDYTGLSSGVSLRGDSADSYLGVNGGQVGIGDSSPDSRFEISGNAGTDELLMLSSSDDADGDIMIVPYTGRVGIGDMTPDNLLDISTTSQAALAITSLGTDTDALIKFELADGTATFSMGVDDSDSDTFKIGSTALGVGDFFAIETTGDVGIGTTTPTSKLHVVTNTYASTTILERSGQTADNIFTAARLLATKTSNMGDGFGSALAFNIRDDAGVINVIADIAGVRSGGNDAYGDLVFRTIGTGGVLEKMRIMAEGNVGIGDASPDDLLNISSASAQAALAITSLGTDTDSLIKFELADGTATFSMGVDDSDSDKFKISTTGLGTNDRFIIDSSGHIGMGVSPSTNLHLSENNTDTTPTFEIEQLSTGDAGLQFSIVGDSFAMGIDNSDADEFKISYAASEGTAVLGTGDLFMMDSAGLVEITGSISAGGATRQAYSQIGSGQTKDGANINDDNDLFIHNSLEVEGTFYLTGGSAAIVNADVAEVLLTERGREHRLCLTDPNCVVEEEYVKDELDFGDLVCMNDETGQTITRCTEANSSDAVGFVSETAVIKMGNSDSVGYPIAVAGIALAHVTNVNGDINPGDLLVSAERDGYAMKADGLTNASIIGKAYDFCDAETCKIPVFVVLVDNAGGSNGDLESIATSTDPTPGSYAERFFGNLFARMGNWLADAANGIASIFTDRLTTKELCVADGSGDTTCVTKDQLDALLYNAISGSSKGSGKGSGASSGGNSTSGNPDPTPTPTPTPDPDPVVDPEPEEPVPDPTPTPDPDPVVDPEPAPEEPAPETSPDADPVE